MFFPFYLAFLRWHLEYPLGPVWGSLVQQRYQCTRECLVRGHQESRGHVAYVTACSIQRQTEKAVFVQPEGKLQGDLIQLPNGTA